jgi:hypothetical protein
VREGREATAERLLRSTAARSYDPGLDIDWSAPAEPGRGFIPHHRAALRFGGEKIAAFLLENGLIGGPSARLWRRSFLLG